MDKETEYESLTATELKSFLDSKFWRIFYREVQAVLVNANAKLMNEDNSVEIYRFQGRIQATMDLLEMPNKWLEGLIESEADKSNNLTSVNNSRLY